MAENITLALLWGWPVLLGLFVWLTKASYAVQYMDRLEVWLAATKARLKSSTGWIVRYWGRPASLVALSPFSITAPIKDPFLRSGTRVALTPYVAGAILVGTFIELELVVAFGCIFLASLIWGFVSNLGSRRDEDDSYETPPQPLSRLRASVSSRRAFGEIPQRVRA